MADRFRIDADGYRNYGDLSAVEPVYRVAMSCEPCRTRWLGCWDAFECPVCLEINEASDDCLIA